LLATISLAPVGAVLAYRANDSNAILDWIVAQGAVSAVPPHESHAGTRETDGSVDKERAKFECLFGKIVTIHSFETVLMHQAAIATVVCSAHTWAGVR
jgi:hypothetical protein